jgi:hypothetical protein
MYFRKETVYRLGRIITAVNLTKMNMLDSIWQEVDYCAKNSAHIKVH